MLLTLDRLLPKPRRIHLQSAARRAERTADSVPGLRLPRRRRFRAFLRLKRHRFFRNLKSRG